MDGSNNLSEHVRRWISRAQCVVSLSKSMTTGLVHAGLDERRVVEIPNAVDMESFRGNFDRHAFLASNKIQGGVCLCVARNHPQKDLPTLFRAFGELRRSMEGPIHLVVVGRGMRNYPLNPELADSVKLLELAPSSPQEFPPAELIRWYRASDLFVMTSEVEGFSTALVEAMAAGLPVVATDVAGIRERVVSGKNGWLHRYRDAEGIANSMRRLLLNEEERQRFGEEAKQSAARFSWDNTISAYNSLYKKLVQDVADGSGLNNA
jgi:glycosyltransferase involved in cell wall biosynthesis